MEKFFEIVNHYDKIIVQTHDNPDADALASGFGVYTLVEMLGKECELIYHGREITKPNLTEMVRTLKIPIVNKGKDFEIKDTELLIIVDGQRGNKNVYSYSAKNIACIDHHILETPFDYLYSKIESKVGSCSTLVYSYLKYLNKPIRKEVLTSLYFGLLMDTNNFVIKYTNLDRDCREELETQIDKKVITKLMRTSLTFDDVNVIAGAMTEIERYEDVIFSKIGDFDDNLLGHISDMVSEVAGINIVVIYAERKDGWKLSIRSYHDYISAENLIVALTDGIGSGGGHINKAGGFIPAKLFQEKYPNSTFDTFIKIKTNEFCKTLKVFVEGKDDPLEYYGRNSFKSTIKKKYNVRYIELSKYFPPEETINVKTLEGTVTVKCDNILIIGVKGEIYPITKEMFNIRYKVSEEKTGIALCDGSLGIYGITLSGESSALTINEENIQQFPIATTTKQTRVLTKHFKGGLKIRTRWGDNFILDRGYLIYINKDNYYLCDEEIFALTYELLDELDFENIN